MEYKFEAVFELRFPLLTQAFCISISPLFVEGRLPDNISIFPLFVGGHLPDKDYLQIGAYSEQNLVHAWS